MHTASLTVCQSQASSSATSETVRPPPTWRVAHLAALVVSRHCLAAMRWSSSTQDLLAQPGFTQRIRCFFHASDIGRAIDGQVDVVDDRALFDPGPLCAGRTSNLVDHLLDHELDVVVPIARRREPGRL